ncbi:MAG TPA: insulinase family protein [Chitinophagaceae bacterium]|nr:insulinase family protein [Chitinophagaceae bacterium]
MKFLKLFILLFFVSDSFLFGQQNLTDTLPVDPNVKVGKLSNGLTYYIRQNKKPEQKIELRLVVNAGSVLEDDNQQGLAHLSEHMAFNGTTHFKKNDIISFLQSIGVQFGNDLNAYTSFDETVYILPIPTDKPGNIDTGFQILQDWAHNVTYNADDIDGERPIILEEKRLGKGANDRMYRQIYPDIFYGSLYADRLPIGIDSIIKNASYETIRKFYHDWYRPDLIAVIVVGDIDPGKAEELVKKYFGGLTNPPDERPRIHPPLKPYDHNLAKVVTDKEATGYTTLINYSSRPLKPVVTLGDYKKDLTKDIFTSMFNERLRELTQKENPPFVYAYTYIGSSAWGFESFGARIGTGSDSSARGLQAFEEELQRVKKYGFTKPELERVKSNLLTEIENSYNERTKTESANYTSEYIDNFLTQDPIPGIANEFKYYKELLPQITLDDVNEVSNKVFENSHQFIALLGPEPQAGHQLPASDDLLAVAEAAEKMEVKPYEEKVIASSLLSKPPKPGKIINSKSDAKLGTTEFTLSNGVTVTVKPTDFKNDQILMSAVRAGGKNNYGVEDKYNAEYATAVVNSMGVGNFTPVDLQKTLSGKTVKVSPVFSNISDGVSGNSSIKDFETMLQLTYLYFTSPRKDTALFRSFIQKNKTQLAFLSANPQVTFIDTLFKTLYHHDPLAPVTVPKPEYFDQINLDRVLQIYKEKFGNAYGMHFTFVGSINMEEIKPLLEKYIASLPSSPGKFNYTDNKLRLAKGTMGVTINKGKDPKSLILEIYNGEAPYSDELSLKADAISEILNIRIDEELREKIQGIYAGGTQAQFEKLPYSHYVLYVQLPCNPEKVDTLLIAMRSEIKNLIDNGPSKENLDKVKQQWIEQYKVNVKENGSWLSNLQEAYFPGDNIDYFINYEKYVNALTPEEIQDAAKLLLSTKNVLTGVLLPEKGSK